ncbi:Adenosine 3'-phospho 5'-phosphosulfate transporter 2 [Thelohanellus kitauei]|uniref:Adenosine 3'-phospho 5'-phosphosulfate transporter 2 n=1 Tax=Thelohanellus kitauei TaxID=669202 RepID=A0A0C2JTH3_THEKT|nr:Adenosine 3'-phospho 5'-phosphosulfate transporter 2 [Thelohanellus kitauei]
MKDVTDGRYFGRFMMIRVGPMGRSSYFILCAFNVIFYHVLAGVFQGYIYTDSRFKNHGLLLSFAYFMYCFIFSLLEMVFSDRVKPLSTKRNFKALSVLGTCLSISIGLSNISFAYINYTAQVMFKCCKPIFVMMATLIMFGCRLSCQKIISCILMTMGIIWYSLANVAYSPEFQTRGVVYICLALTFDAITPNLTQRLLNESNIDILDSICLPSLVGGILLLVVDIIIGDFAPAINDFNDDPYRIFFLVLFQSMFIYLGTYDIMCLVKNFTALLSVHVTNFRKLVSVTLSLILFEKAFTLHHLFSSVLLFMGLILESIDFKSLAKMIEDTKTFLHKKFPWFSNKKQILKQDV